MIEALERYSQAYSGLEKEQEKILNFENVSLHTENLYIFSQSLTINLRYYLKEST